MNLRPFSIHDKFVEVLEKIEALRKFVIAQIAALTAYVNGQIAALTAYVNGQIADLTTFVNSSINDLTNYVNGEIIRLEGLINNVTGALESGLAALTTYINNEIAKLKKTTDDKNQKLTGQLSPEDDPPINLSTVSQQIQNITGKTDNFTAPDISLTTVNTHVNKVDGIVHGYSGFGGTPTTINSATSGYSGSLYSVARSDHKHDLDATLKSIAGISGSSGYILYYTGVNTVETVGSSSVGRTLIGQNTKADVISYLGISQFPGFGPYDPITVDNGSADVGSALTVAHSDHKHALAGTVKSLADLTGTSGNFLYFTGTNTIGQKTPTGTLTAIGAANEYGNLSNYFNVAGINFSSTSNKIYSSNNGLYFQSNGTLYFGLNSAGALTQMTSAASLGSSGVPWTSSYFTNIYSTNIYSSGTSTIGTTGTRFTSGYFTTVYSTNALNGSDIRIKKDIADSDLGLDFILSLRPVKFKYKSEIEPDLNAPFHYGLIAQELRDILQEKEFSGYKYDKKEDSYYIGYTEFIAPLITAAQEEHKNILALEKRIDQLESIILELKK